MRFTISSLALCAAVSALPLDGRVSGAHGLLGVGPTVKHLTHEVLGGKGDHLNVRMEASVNGLGRTVPELKGLKKTVKHLTHGTLSNGKAKGINVRSEGVASDVRYVAPLALVREVADLVKELTDVYGSNGELNTRLIHNSGIENDIPTAGVVSDAEDELHGAESLPGVVPRAVDDDLLDVLDSLTSVLDTLLADPSELEGSATGVVTRSDSLESIESQINEIETEVESVDNGIAARTISNIVELAATLNQVDYELKLIENDLSIKKDGSIVARTDIASLQAEYKQVMELVKAVEKDIASPKASTGSLSARSDINIHSEMANIKTELKQIEKELFSVNGKTVHTSQLASISHELSTIRSELENIEKDLQNVRSGAHSIISTRDLPAVGSVQSLEEEVTSLDSVGSIVRRSMSLTPTLNSIEAELRSIIGLERDARAI